MASARNAIEVTLEDAPPCPFCGARALSIQYTATEFYTVLCQPCGARGPLGDGRLVAVRRWTERQQKETPHDAGGAAAARPRAPQRRS